MRGGHPEWKMPAFASPTIAVEELPSLGGPPMRYWRLYRADVEGALTALRYTDPDAHTAFVLSYSVMRRMGQEKARYLTDPEIAERMRVSRRSVIRFRNRAREWIVARLSTVVQSRGPK